ncbi:hypothetical protein Tco_0051288 [Tanacetum coccineum]
MLKVSPWKGEVRLSKRGKLNPSYVGPSKAMEKVGSVAYKLELPQELNRVHNTFHVSNLKKCYADEPLAVSLDGLYFDDKLQFVKEPAIINLGVTVALAARDANRSTNGEDSHNSGTGIRRTERVAQECTYQDFIKCQPLYCKGTEGVVELTQWFERMETVFRISNCSMENHTKFSTCTLLASDLTWWNSHVMTVGHDVANGIKKLEAELWNLKVKESDKVERYVGGLPDMIHGSVVASKLKTMQEATKMEIELMDKKISTLAERQPENKRKLDNNNQAQQQYPKRQIWQAAPQWAMYCKVAELQEVIAAGAKEPDPMETMQQEGPVTRRHLIPNLKPRIRDTSLVALGLSAIKLDCQKNYTDVRRKPLEFQVDNRVMLKVSPWKGEVRLSKRGKLNPSYVGPSKAMEKVGSVAYKLEHP